MPFRCRQLRSNHNLGRIRRFSPVANAFTSPLVQANSASGAFPDRPYGLHRLSDIMRNCIFKDPIRGIMIVKLSLGIYLGMQIDVKEIKRVPKLFVCMFASSLLLVMFALG